jgi:hypothetical protein
VVGCIHSSFPNLTFLQFPITVKRENR